MIGNDCGMQMNVVPAGYNNGYGNGNGNGMWGGDWASWIILFLIFGMFGFGGFGGFGAGGFGGFGGFGGGYGVESILQRQLDTQSIIQKLDGITNGICDGFYAMNNAINGVGQTVERVGNGLQMTYMQGQNAIQSQLSGCCCDIERAIDGVRYDNAKDTCAILNQMNTNTRDIVDNQNSNTRAILDYLCNEKIQSLRDQLAAKDNALQTAEFRASQLAQTATIVSDIRRFTGNDCPVAAYVVQPQTPVSFATNCSGQAILANTGCGQCNGNWNGYNC